MQETMSSSSTTAEMDACFKWAVDGSAQSGSNPHSATTTRQSASSTCTPMAASSSIGSSWRMISA
eukprot:5483039-Pleurochrysis_carterae.AAC.1